MKTEITWTHLRQFYSCQLPYFDNSCWFSHKLVISKGKKKRKRKKEGSIFVFPVISNSLLNYYSPQQAIYLIRSGYLQLTKAIEIEMTKFLFSFASIRFLFFIFYFCFIFVFLQMSNWRREKREIGTYLTRFEEELWLGKREPPLKLVGNTTVVDTILSLPSSLLLFSSFGFSSLSIWILT